MELSKKICSEM